MKKIKIKFVDFWEDFQVEEFYVYKILKERYDVIISNNPDYIFYSCFGHEHLKYRCIKIFYTGENLRPDFNICDYAIGFDYLEFGDRYIRYPLYLMCEKYLDNFNLAVKRKNIKLRNKFCNMVVSNGNFHLRNLFYHELNKYKKVDSGGKYLNNIGYQVIDKLKFQKDYKFALAFENSKTIGYITEKIFDAFAAGCIPIYYGDPKIIEIINPNSFVYVEDEKNFQRVIDLIQKIDQDEKLYKSYLKQNVLIDSNYLKNQQYKLKKFIYNIFEQDINEARRCDPTYFVDLYQKYQLESYKAYNSIFSKIKRKIKRIFRLN